MQIDITYIYNEISEDDLYYYIYSMYRGEWSSMLLFIGQKSYFWLSEFKFLLLSEIDQFFIDNWDHFWSQLGEVYFIKTFYGNFSLFRYFVTLKGLKAIKATYIVTFTVAIGISIGFFTTKKFN